MKENKKFLWTFIVIVGILLFLLLLLRCAKKDTTKTVKDDTPNAVQRHIIIDYQTGKEDTIYKIVEPEE